LEAVIGRNPLLERFANPFSLLRHFTEQGLTTIFWASCSPTMTGSGPPLGDCSALALPTGWRVSKRSIDQR
jgi:hypothetical protein